MYFHIHIHRLAFVFLFFLQGDEIGQPCEKKKTSDICSSKPPVPRSLQGKLSNQNISHFLVTRQIREVFHRDQTEEQPGWGSPWVTPLVGKPFVDMIIPIPLNKTWAGIDLSGDTPSSGPQSCHLAPWALSGSGSSSAWGFPQIIPCHSHLIPYLLISLPFSHWFFPIISCLSSLFFSSQELFSFLGGLEALLEAGLAASPDVWTVKDLQDTSDLVNLQLPNMFFRVQSGQGLFQLF